MYIHLYVQYIVICIVSFSCHLYPRLRCTRLSGWGDQLSFCPYQEDDGTLHAVPKRMWKEESCAQFVCPFRQIL